MPTILELFGLRFFFYSLEHEPIHIHVENADGAAKFDIEGESVKLVATHGMKPRDLRKAEATIAIYKDEFIAAWHKYFEK